MVYTVYSSRIRPPLFGFFLAASSGCIDTKLNEASTEGAVNPSFIDFGTVAPGGTAPATLSLDNIGSGRLTLLSTALLGDSAFSLVSDPSGTEILNGESLSLDVAFSPGSEGWISATLTLQTDANTGDSAFDIALVGHAASPSLVVSPSAVDFGSVAPGADQFVSVTLQSLGDMPVTITRAELGGDATFYLAGDVTLPFTVPAGGAVALSIGFGAADMTAQTASLTLDSDDPDLGVVSVPVVANNCEGEGAVDADGDGISECAGDCDDTRQDVYPGAAETIDNIDNDCDGRVDNDTDAYDDDGDGYTESEGDCDDSDAATSPDAIETVDGADQDCDGAIDDGTEAYDDDGDGFSEEGGDCNDANSRVNPSKTETSNGVDDDCDGLIDEGTSSIDDDGDGYTEGAGDCDDSDGTIFPAAAETANGKDDDCDGSVDEGTTAYDDDGDGYTEDGGDCNDANAAIGPATLEVTGDGIDNDCDGSTR